MILSPTLYNYWTEFVSVPGVKTGLVIVLLSAVEVSPVKINPWSWIGGIIGKLLGIKTLSDKVDALDEKVDINQATTIRVRILRFEDEVQNNIDHSKDSWDQVMDDINRYEEYTECHPKFKNNITEASINHLKKKYDELLEKRAWTITLVK
jgi:hypothetical protein